MTLSKVLARIRREGVWVLAGVAPLASIKVWALLAGPEEAARASRIAPADLVLAGLAAAAAVEVIMTAMLGRPSRLASLAERARSVGERCGLRYAIPPAAAFGWVAAAAISAVFMIVREWGELPGGAAGGAAREVVQLVEILIVGYGWTLWAVRDRRDLDRALLAIGVAVTVNVLLALVQLASGAHVFHVRGLFANRNSLGVFLAVTLPLLVAAASTDGKRPAPVRLWLLGVSSIGLAIMTSGALFVAAAIGVIVAAFASSRPASLGAAPRSGPLDRSQLQRGASAERLRAPCIPTWRAGWAALAAVAVIALLIQPLALSSVRKAQFRSVEPFHAVGRRTSFAPSERLRRWAAALECLRDNPTFGVGPGQYQSRIEDYYLQGFGKGGGSSVDPDAFDVSFDEPGSHGLWEVAACETGLAGCLAVVWFLAAVLVRLGRAARVAAPDSTSGALMRRAAAQSNTDERGIQDVDGSRRSRAGPPAHPVGGAASSAPEFAAGALGAVVAVAVAGVFASVLVQGVVLPFVIVLALGERSRAGSGE